MLPPDVSKTLDDWLLAEFEVRTATLTSQFRRKQNELAARGMIQSGAMIAFLVDLAAQELTIRAAITFERFLMAAGDCGVRIDDSFRPYARNDLERRIMHILVPELRSWAQEAVNFRAVPGNLLSKIDRAGDVAKRKFWAELDSAITRSKTRNRGDQPAASNVFHVSGTVGVIQIGSGNSATSLQQIEGATVASFRELLSQLHSEVEALPDLDLPAPKEELIDTIRAGESELAKIQPNWTLARALLSGVGCTIQSVAALQPAYETLKGLLALIGVRMP